MGYTKTRDPWTASNPLSGKAMNHIETQWDAIRSDVDVHGHDTLYYPKTEADEKFFDTVHYQGRDADLLDGLHIDEIIGAAIPIGGIIAWNGTADTVPAGYGICNGDIYSGYPSPDLRDRFVIGAGGLRGNGATGGSESNIVPTGAVSVAGHVLTTNELPSHRHVYVDNYNPWTVYLDNMLASYYYTVQTLNRTTGQQDDGGGDPHGHPGSTIVFNGFERLPLYYSLIFIMRYT